MVVNSVQHCTWNGFKPIYIFGAFVEQIVYANGISSKQFNNGICNRISNIYNPKHCTLTIRNLIEIRAE